MENPNRKSHQVMLSVTFDRLCTNAEAVAAVRDCIHGNFYPGVPARSNAPERFRIRGVARIPKKRPA